MEYRNKTVLDFPLTLSLTIITEFRVTQLKALWHVAFLP